MRDIVVAFRQFLKSPGYAITVVLTLALGIGANTAIFTLVHAVLMKSLPVADPKTLYRVGDLDDCCVNGGFRTTTGTSICIRGICTGTSGRRRRSFSRLAAMQSGGQHDDVAAGSRGGEVDA